MLCTVLHLGANFFEASTAPVGDLAVVERVGELADLTWSEDLVVIFYYFEDLLVVWMLDNEQTGRNYFCKILKCLA
jgi:hypothetical protein